MRKRDEGPRRRREEEPEESRLKDVVIDVPSDPANEQVVLAAMMVDLATCDRLLPLLPPDAFHTRMHRRVRVVIGLARERGLDLDPATLARLDPEADVRVLERLPAARPDVPENIDFHVETLLWDWRRAQATKGPISALLEAVQNPTEEPARVQALARQVGQAFEGEHGKARFIRERRELVGQATRNLEKRVEGEAFYPFGIEGLDHDEHGNRRCRPGAAPGQVTVLTAMSGSGKSTIAAHMINGIARQGRRVLVGAWEVRAPMTLELLATLDLGWSRSRTLDGKTHQPREPGEDDAITREELLEIQRAMWRITKNVTFMDNPFRRGMSKGETGAKFTNDDVLDVLESHIRRVSPDVVVLDLFDRCLRHRRPDDEQEAIWRMVDMTDELQIHLVLVHQQLLKGENVRADKRPTLEGLKGSSAYVDAGALILAPHLPARHKDVPNDKMELFALKTRHGEEFAVEFDWEPDTGQISGGRTFKASHAVEQQDETDPRAPVPRRGFKSSAFGAKRGRS